MTEFQGIFERKLHLPSFADVSRCDRVSFQDPIIPPNALVQDQARLNRETWAIFEDISKSVLPLGPRPGDLRAAIAPFLANESTGKKTLLPSINPV